MKLTRANILNGISVLLALMFFYAAYSKLIDYDKSRQEMLNQVFPRAVAMVLLFLVPITELLIVVLLLFRHSRRWGLYGSLILLVAFSVYISVSMSGVFGRVPCSCGGILKHMGYWTHLAFNVFFIVLVVLGIALEKQWKPINRWLDFLNRKGGASKLRN